MADQPRTLLSSLIELSKIDASLAAIAADRKRREADLAAKKAKVRELEHARNVKRKELEEKRGKYQKEEKSVREDTEKLVGRRKALSTFSNYKLQQAAEKEIEQSAKEVSSREEIMLSWLDEVDKLEKEKKTLEDAYNAGVRAYDESLTEVTELFTTLEDRELTYQRERYEIVPLIDAKELLVYNRARDRFPADPVVPLQGSVCSGCFMQVGPQVLVQISRATSLTRCPGCGRIVYMEKSKEE